jgi:hypothetical protein
MNSVEKRQNRGRLSSVAIVAASLALLMIGGRAVLAAPASTGSGTYTIHQEPGRQWTMGRLVVGHHTETISFSGTLDGDMRCSVRSVLDQVAARLWFLSACVFTGSLDGDDGSASGGDRGTVDLATGAVEVQFELRGSRGESRGWLISGDASGNVYVPGSSTYRVTYRAVR